MGLALVLFITQLLWASLPQPQTILPFEGIGNYTLRETKIGTVKNDYPDVSTKKEWVQTFILQGHYSKTMEPDSGIELTFRRYKIIDAFRLSTISLTGSFAGKTPGGLGIGSSYVALTKEFDEPLKINTNKTYSYVSIDSTDTKTDLPGVLMIFICDNPAADSTNFVINSIQFY